MSCCPAARRSPRFSRNPKAVRPNLQQLPTLSAHHPEPGAEPWCSPPRMSKATPRTTDTALLSPRLLRRSNAEDPSTGNFMHQHPDRASSGLNAAGHLPDIFVHKLAKIPNCPMHDHTTIHTVFESCPGFADGKLGQAKVGTQVFEDALSHSSL